MNFTTVKSSATRWIGPFVIALAAFGGSANAQDRAPADLNDLEIAHVAYTAGTIDIRYAHLALAISENPEIRSFAETMIRDHTAVNDQAVALVQKLSITPQDNFMSQSLVAGSKDIVNELRQLSGSAFDKRYAANELGYHQTVNSVVGGTFIPNAQTPELKALLKSALKTFEVHEGHAAAMASKVGA